jgi:outer membrane protein OmpA-like peptidoglycan-associated protein
VPVAEAPAETKPADAPAPAVVEAPKAEEQPAETEAVDAKSSEERPAGPAVRERRRKTPEAAAPAPAPAEMTVAFEKTSSELSPAAQKDLDTVITQIKDMPDLRIQIRAHATDADGNASNARRLSLSRGLMVRSYLTEKGISPSRLDVRALGAEGDAPSDQVELVLEK